MFESDAGTRLRLVNGAAAHRSRSTDLEPGFGEVGGAFQTA
jgi:hypothetical protein